MKIKKRDKVKIIAGKDKGAEGIVERVYTKSHRILVEGVNFVTKHLKPKGKQTGGIVRVNKSIHVSNAMLMDSKTEKPSRVGYKIVDEKKYRFSKKSGEIVNLEKSKK